MQILKSNYKNKLFDNSKNKEIFREILSKRGAEILVDGPTGSGKSYSTINTMKDESKNNKNTIYIMTFPNRSLSEQAGKKYEVVSVVGNKNAFRDYDFKEERVFCCVYDKLKELREEIDNYKEKRINYNVVLCIDECHNLSLSLSYRKKVINEIEKMTKYIKDNNGTIIYVSATTDVMKYKKYDYHYIFEQDGGYKCFADNVIINIIDSKKEELDDVIFNIIKDDNYVIRYNNIDSTSKLVKSLESLKNEDGTKKKVDFMNSNTKNFYYDKNKEICYYDELTENVINNEKLTNANYHFFTCIADAGLNFTDIEGLTDKSKTKVMFVVQNANDLIFDNIQQFASRCRFDFDEFHILIKFKEQKENKKENLKSFKEMLSLDKFILNKNLEYSSMLLDVLKLKYNKNMEELRKEIEYQFNYTNSNDYRNDMGCIYLNDNYEITYDEKLFYYNTYLKYNKQFINFENDFIKEIEKRFNKKAKINRITDKMIVDKVSEKIYMELLNKLTIIMNDENKIKEIESNRIKSEEVKYIESFNIYRDIKYAQKIKIKVKDTINSILNDNYRDLINDKIKEYIKNMTDREKRLFEINIKTENYESKYLLFQILLSSDYAKYYKKSIRELDVDIDTINNIIIKSNKFKELDNFLLTIQYINNNKFYKKNYGLLIGQFGKEQEYIIKYFTNKKGNISRCRLTKEKIRNLKEDMLKDIKVKYSYRKIENIIHMIFNVNETDNYKEITSLRMKY